MKTFFNPKSMVIFGISEKKKSIPNYILDNTRRWGYKGRIYGVMPGCGGETIKGVPVFNSVTELPEVPELAVMLIPAKFVPPAMRECGKIGIRRAAILSGGFNESGEAGEGLAEDLKAAADEYGIRFIGPNGLTVADASSGVCLPFVPHQKMHEGGFSFISQSGGFFLVLWNLMQSENVGMAKFASIGNKLNVDETDILEYLGNDPKTEVIGLYLESIQNGERLVEVARCIDKPIIALKANRSEAGGRAAMSHTASMSNNDDVVDAAFERAGIIRVDNVHDLIHAVRIFKLPPMRRNRLMVMTPGGGAAVMKADLAEKEGFDFADPGEAFYEGLHEFTNAGGIIKFSNPLDMGDIYNTAVYPEIFRRALASDDVDGIVYGHARPLFPPGDDSIFKKMFNTDISEETIRVMEDAGKPIVVSMSAPGRALLKMKQNLPCPIFDRSEDAPAALRIQSDYYMRRQKSESEEFPRISFDEAGQWLEGRHGDVGEEALELLQGLGMGAPASRVAASDDEAVAAAEEMGYPVVMKIVSPDVLHKSDAGGVKVNIYDGGEVRDAFRAIIASVRSYNENACIDGVRVSAMAEEGTDMFIGAMRDPSFGPVVVYGYGGIYTEVFKDIAISLCPAPASEIRKKLKKLKCHAILAGARGSGPADIDAYVDTVQRMSLFMAEFPQISEFDLNPVRVFSGGRGALSLDARMRIKSSGESGNGKMSETMQRKSVAAC